MVVDRKKLGEVLIPVLESFSWSPTSNETVVTLLSSRYFIYQIPALLVLTSACSVLN